MDNRCVHGHYRRVERRRSCVVTRATSRTRRRLHVARRGLPSCRSWRYVGTLSHATCIGQPRFSSRSRLHSLVPARTLGAYRLCSSSPRASQVRSRSTLPCGSVAACTGSPHPTPRGLLAFGGPQRDISCATKRRCACDVHVRRDGMAHVCSHGQGRLGSSTRTDPNQLGFDWNGRSGLNPTRSPFDARPKGGGSVTRTKGGVDWTPRSFCPF